MKKKREDRSSTSTAGSSDGASDSPFAKLAHLKAQLPTAPLERADDDKAVSEKAPATSGVSAKIVVRRERARRGGKTVTVIEGLALDDPSLAALASELKRSLGCGAVVEGSALVLQGDLDERVASLLEQKGLGRVVLGTRKR